MKDPYKIDVELRKSEVIRYNFSHIRWIILADTVGLGIFIFITYLSFAHPEPGTRDLLQTLSIWAAVALAIGLAQPFVVLLQVLFAKPEAMQKITAERSYNFTDEGIEIESLGRTAIKIWGEIKRIKILSGLLLIYTGKKVAYVIPKRCFKNTEKWRSFLSFIKEKIKS